MRLNPERKPVGRIEAHRIIQERESLAGNDAAGLIFIGEPTITQDIERTPHTRITRTHAPEIQRAVSIRETEIRILTFEITLLPRKRDDIRRIHAIVRILQREGRDTRLVGVTGNHAVRNATGYPDHTLVDVAAILQQDTLADHFQDPGLFLIDDGETLALGIVTIFIGQSGHALDGLARRLATLQGDVNQRTIVHDTETVRQFFTAAKGRLTDDELVLIHVADPLVCMCNLLDIT